MIHLAIRFVLELAALAAAGFVGASLGDPPFGLVGGIAAVVAFGVVWGLWIAPRARFPLSRNAQLVVGTALMLVAAVGLLFTGQPVAGEILVATILANAILIALTGAKLEDGRS